MPNDEQKPESDSENSETGRTDASGVLRFFEELPKTRRKLSSPVPEEHQLSVARRQAEWAKGMIGNRQFQEAIQLMNEQILVEMTATSPLDHPRLAALCARTQVISDFQHTLEMFIDEFTNREAEMLLAEKEREQDYA